MQNRRSGHKWVIAAFCAVGVGVLALAVLAVLAQAFEWVGFWRGAGQPFATVVAGLAALTAGALALSQWRTTAPSLAHPALIFWSNGTTTLASGEFFASWYADSRVAGTASRSRYTPISCSRTLIRC